MPLSQHTAISFQNSLNFQIANRQYLLIQFQLTSDFQLCLYFSAPGQLTSLFLIHECCNDKTTDSDMTIHREAIVVSQKARRRLKHCQCCEKKAECSLSLCDASLKNIPFSRILHRNHWFRGPIKHIIFKQNTFFVLLYTKKHTLCESENNCIQYSSIYFVFFITSNSNMRNKQMEINACKILRFSQFRGLMPAKWPLILDFVNFAPPIEKIPIFCENGYEHGICFGREWTGPLCLHSTTLTTWTPQS